MSGVKKPIQCPCCNDVIGYGTTRTKGRILGGHIRHCKSSAPREKVLSEYVEEYHSNIFDEYSIHENLRSDSDINPTYLDFQIAITHVFKDKRTNFVQGRVMCENGAYAYGYWEDYLDIMQFKVNTGLSLDTGNDMLALIRNLCKRRQWYLAIPTTMRTIVQAFDATSCSDYGIKEIQLHFDRDILSPQEIPTLKPCTAGLMNPLYSIAEWFLSLSEGDVLIDPDNSYTRDGTELNITNFASGDVFRRLHKAVKEKYGEDVYPICVDLNFDGMGIDIIGKNKLKPLKIRIKNVADSIVECEANMFTAAYGPVFHHTDKELEAFLSRTIDTLERQSEALRYLKR